MQLTVNYLREKSVEYILLLLLMGISLPLNAKEEVIIETPPPASLFTFPAVYDPFELLCVKVMLYKGEKLLWAKPDSARLWLHKAIEKSRRIGYPDGIARAHISLGLTEVGIGQFHRAFTCYQAAYPYVLQSQQREFLLCSLYLNIGATHFYQADYEQALHYYYLVLQHTLKYGTHNFNIVMAYNNLADVLLKMEQYDQAAYYIRKGEELQVDEADRIHLRTFLTANKAGVAIGKGDDSTGRVLLEKALIYARESDNKDATPALWNAIGEMLLRQHKPNEAIAYLKLALKVDSTTYFYYSIIIPGYNLGRALYQTGNYKEAEKTLLTTLHTAEKAGIREGKLEAIATLATVYEQSGLPGKALEQHKRFISLQDSLLDKEKIKSINAMEARYRTSEKDRELVRRQLEIATQRRNIDRKNLWLVISTGGLLLAGLLFLALYKSNKQRQAIAILEAMIAGEEKERSRTAQELHDGIGGLLAAIQMKLSMVGTEGISDIAAMTKEAANEVRKTAHNLMPDVIQRYTFAEAVCMYCETINQAGTGLQVDLQIHEPVSAGSKKTELSLYRIIQELLQNIAKHAEASQAIVQINQQYNELTIMIEDNGKGFDTSKVSKGLGIHNLNLRVKMLKGILSIESMPGKGTTVTISVTV